MSRPQSGKRRPLSANLRPKSASRTIGDSETYEELLVAQYLQRMKDTQPFASSRPSSMSGPSPYLQQLAHSHIVPAPGLARNRPFSAKPKLQDTHTEFIDATGHSGLSPRDKRKKRPFSAPARRPLSATYSYGFGSRPTSAKSGVFGGKRIKPLYRRQPLTIVATAFKNGCRDVFARVAAPSLKMLLELCTDKLNLGNAARRVFLEDGTEIHSPSEIHRDADIYISMGEPFKDPYKGAKNHSTKQASLNWTMNGLVWPQENKKKSTKPRLSRRFRDMIEQSRRRVLVFRNGAGTEGVEIVADPDRFEDFLVACTAKLDLGSYARVLYDWEGNAISNLDEAPVLDSCLQTWGTPVLGPLWVSKGEGFSPKGANEFLSGLITYTRSKLKEAKDYQQQLKYAQDEDTKQNIKIAPILSMGETEIEETLDIVAKDIEEFSNALNRLKEQLSLIRDKYAEEQSTPGYTLQHINKFEADHRMVGTKGLRLRVFENGTYDNETIVFFNLQQATRGIGNDSKQLMARLLDQLSSSHHLANPIQNTALNLMAQKIYDQQGKELKNVYELEYDQEIWLSFGEPWKNPFTFVLTATFDKVRAFDVEGQGHKASREQLMSEDTSGKDRPSVWDSVEGIPEDFNMVQIHSGTDAMEREHSMAMLETGEISPHSHFLRSKDNPELMLFPDIVMDKKKKKTSKDVWPSEAQIWVVSKSGHICCKSMPQIVLAVSDLLVKTTLSHPTLGPTETPVEGYLVCLQCKNGSPSQQWGFSADGYVYNQSQPELVLTYLGSRFGDEDSMVPNEEENFPKGLKCYAAVCVRLEGKDSKSQRWALKQERYDNLGQWKHTQTENPEWNKRALSWPVKEDGDLNDNFDWPMEGYLLPYAPSLKKTEGPKINQASKGPLRLMVLKNGVREVNKAMAVVGPDLNNMRKDMNPKKGKKKGHRRTTSVERSTNEDSNRSEEDLTVLKLEFLLFLERCTALLNLPFAARRLFDESGKEQFTLAKLQRDKLVYVSCGDPWSDPNVNKAEQQRRYLLNNLGGDVKKIRQYSAMKSPETPNDVRRVGVNQPNNQTVGNNRKSPSGRPVSAKRGRKGSKNKGKNTSQVTDDGAEVPSATDVGSVNVGDGSDLQPRYEPYRSDLGYQHAADTDEQNGYEAPKIVVRPPSAKKPIMDYENGIGESQNYEYNNDNSYAHTNGVSQNYEYGNVSGQQYGYEDPADHYQQVGNPYASYEESPLPSVRGSLASMDNVNGAQDPYAKPVVVEMPDSHSSGEQDENTPPEHAMQHSKPHRVSFQEY